MESATDIAPILTRIARLRKLAASTTSESEADNAMRAAAKLIEAHRIDEASLETGDIETEKATHDEANPIVVGARIDTWKVQLVCSLARHFGCKPLKAKLRGLRVSSRITVVGRPSDVALLRAMFAWIEPELARRARRAESRASYLMGAVAGVDSQLAASRLEARRESSATSSALVRLDSRAEEAQAMIRGTMPDVKSRTVKSQARIDRGDYHAGVADGRAMDLSGGRRALRG